MSQERTEQQQGSIDFKRENEALASAKSQLRDLDAHYRSEIDRLNADNADKDAQIERMRAEVQRLELKLWNLTAKVQERDEHIRGLESRTERMEVGRQERDKEIERLSWSNGEQVKEIERLKSELESAMKWGREQRQSAKAAKQAWYDALPVAFDGDATATNLKAEIERQASENESLRQTLARYFGDAKTVKEYERNEDELRAEIDRLRAVGEHIIYEAVRMGYNDWDEPGFVFEEKSEEWQAALKGAE